MKKQIERTILHIRDLERRLGEADNNLRYIKCTMEYEFDKEGYISKIIGKETNSDDSTEHIHIPSLGNNISII